MLLLRFSLNKHIERTSTHSMRTGRGGGVSAAGTAAAAAAAAAATTGVAISIDGNVVDCRSHDLLQKVGQA